MTINTAKNCTENNSRWNNYTTYRLILWAWMMNEISTVAVPLDISHTGFYTYSVLCICVSVFVGIPLVYSEICVAQYTNCDVLSTWNFCPILRGVGFGTYFLIPLKIVYLMVLTTWYFEYTFMSVMDPPPWYSCDGYNEPKCMVKRINVSVFQHCIEAQNLFNQNCGMKTASFCFFDKIIGSNNTKHTNCIKLWKIVLASIFFTFILFILLIKKEKIVKIIVRIFVGYVCVVLFILFCVSLSSNGTWYATKNLFVGTDFDFKNGFYFSVHSVLACGIGSGVIGFLSRDVSFRSPAAMTAVTIPITSFFMSILFALIIFNGIKTISYYHGGEKDILEVGDSIFFNYFASVSEIMSYFNGIPLWGFLWFSTMFFCLSMNIIILCLILLDFFTSNLKIARKHKNVCPIVMLSLLCVLSCPFYCSDLTVVLADVTEIIQLTSSFFFSAAIYWIYGFQKHNVDIIFMIGVKASYFWKIAWITNPVWMLCLVYTRWSRLLVKEHDNSYYISSLFMNLDELLFYIIISSYYFIVFIGILIQISLFHKHNQIRNIFFPLPNWGPQDEILFRSRNIFLPEIMTREFLYRQVRIHGYSRRAKNVTKKINTNVEIGERLSPENTEWSALTSN